MDERHEQVQVGAGLQESRLNTDLINWLNKWGTHILTVVCVIVLGYVGLQRLEQHRLKQRDAAFSEYEAARGAPGLDGIQTGSPDNLLLVAEQHDGQGSVWELATLDAAEIWLGSAARGLRPGTNVSSVTDEDVLSDEQINSFLAKAGSEFNAVLGRVAGEEDKAPFELRALRGLAAVAMSQGNRDEARGFFERLAERAGTNYARIAKIAELSLAQMDEIPESIVLIAEADLPRSATAPVVLDPTTPTLTPIDAPFGMVPDPIDEIGRAHV